MLMAPVANVIGPSRVTTPSVVIAPFKVIPPFSSLPINSVPISVPLPITPTDVVPVPASRVTVSTLVPAISAIVIFPKRAPVSTTKLLPSARWMCPVANSILSAAVVKVTSPVPVSFILSPSAAVIVVPPSNL